MMIDIQTQTQERTPITLEAVYADLSLEELEDRLEMVVVPTLADRGSDGDFTDDSVGLHRTTTKTGWGTTTTTSEWFYSD